MHHHSLLTVCVGLSSVLLYCYRCKLGAVFCSPIPCKKTASEWSIEKQLPRWICKIKWLPNLPSLHLLTFQLVRCYYKLIHYSCHLSVPREVGVGEEWNIFRVLGRKNCQVTLCGASPAKSLSSSKCALQMVWGIKKFSVSYVFLCNI